MPRIAERILDAVIYLYPSVRAARDGEDAGGTGFLVSLPSEAHPEGRHVYAVTAWHVINPDRGNAPVIRLNTQAGETEEIDRTEQDWTRHPDGDDLAVCPLGIQPEWFKFHSIPTSMFLTHEIITEYAVGPGDEVFMVGRFVNHEGRQRNLPTVRFGNIAMMPWEPIKASPWDIEQESYLVETRSISGYSGSPVFVYLPSWFTVPREGLGGANVKSNMWLLGVDWCHINNDEPVRDAARNRDPVEDGLFVKSNTGMMGVVPSWRLADLLMEDEFVMQRKQSDQEIGADKAKSPVVLDAAQPRELTRDAFEDALRKVSRRIKPSPPDEGTSGT
jgi:hypothetical protein